MKKLYLEQMSGILLQKNSTPEKLILNQSLNPRSVKKLFRRPYCCCNLEF